MWPIIKAKLYEIGQESSESFPAAVLGSTPPQSKNLKENKKLNMHKLQRKYLTTPVASILNFQMYKLNMHTLWKRYNTTLPLNPAKFFV